MREWWWACALRRVKGWQQMLDSSAFKIYHPLIIIYVDFVYDIGYSLVTSVKCMF